MIIKIKQTASNVKQTFDIEGENFCFLGEAGCINRFQKIRIFNKEKEIKGNYQLSKWYNYIPFRYLFGYCNLTRVFVLYENENIFGSIMFSQHGFLKSFYVVALDNGEILHCYCRSKDSFDYVSVYKNDNQIALIETYLNVTDFKYAHKLYLKDEFSSLAEVLSFFTVYYSSYNFAERFHMSGGSTYQKSWSFSKYNNKYNSNWREENFPDENFFGKTNLFK